MYTILKSYFAKGFWGAVNIINNDIEEHVRLPQLTMGLAL